MLNFAVGPVTSGQSVLDVAAEQIPYFRTQKFSAVMKENERLFNKFVNAPDGARAVFITASSTGSMEAAVINTLDGRDRVLIVNGGSFGARFCEICAAHGVPYDEIKCESGHTLTYGQLSVYDGKNYTAFLVNLCETSTGVLYDIDMISDFCKKNGLFLIVDAVSAFLCDSFNMAAHGIDVVITGSQKALALAPGLSLISLSARAQKRVGEHSVCSYYFDLKRYLADGERGQTPFTPAVGILLQLNRRLKEIDEKGGVSAEIAESRKKAEYFRASIKNLPLTVYADKPSMCVTSLTIDDVGKSAYKLFELLTDEYGIWVCPNGGALRDKVFRVGHMGALRESDYDTLVKALSAGLRSEKIDK